MEDAVDTQTFQDEVDKEITTEAPTDAWQHPRSGDLVTVQLQAAEEVCARSWVMGSLEPFMVEGLDLERCVQTMRRGEHATMRLKEAGSNSVSLQLITLERSEDLLGDGRMLRTTVQEGSGFVMPSVGAEVQLRFAWRSLSATPDTNSATTTVHLGSASDLDALLPSREACDLRRTLLRRFGGAVEMRGGSSSTPALRIERGSEVLAEGGMGLEEARAALAPSQGPREAAVHIEEGSCRCSDADWIPGAMGMRVLSDLRAGQRCIVRLAAELAGVGEALEYDVEVLRIMTCEDVSVGHTGGVVKKITREGSGYVCPKEGAEVRVRLEARDDASGAVLVEERELSFSAASRGVCSALDETVLTMKEGEACEITCSDTAACTDVELGLQPSGTVLLRLELLSFEKVDLGFEVPEAERVGHCARRKEVGTAFFQDGSWHRALKRYQHVTSTLSYLDHWTDQEAKAKATSLRRVCHLNTAACWLKLQGWREADEACQLVLREEAGNVKALFRRGQALKGLGEFREAELCMKKVLELDGENREAARALASLRQAAKAQAEQQKVMFSRMARGVVSAEPQEDAGPPPAGDVCAGLDEAPASVQGAWQLGWPLAVAVLVVCASAGFIAARRWRR